MNNNIPSICEKCSLFQNSEKPNKECSFCLDFRFNEEHLCYLNQCSQINENFRCFAFKKNIKILNSSKEINPYDQTFNSPPLLSVIDGKKRKEIEDGRLKTALDNPDDIFVFASFHFVFGTIFRSPLFLHIDIYDARKIYDLFSKLSGKVDDNIKVLLLGTDHIHVYVESNGNKSVDEIANEIKKRTESHIINIIKNHPKNKELLDQNKKIWDKAYFSQTLQA